MKLIDITRTVQDSLLYPGMEAISIEKICDLKNGDPYTTSIVKGGSHLGTHADALTHFIMCDTSIDKMPLEHYYGKCIVLSFPEKAMIDKSMLEGKLKGNTRLLINGGGYTYLTPCAAEYLVAEGVITVATDAWSVAPTDNEIEIHNILLSKGIAVIENLILEGVEDGEYTLSAFPIKYGGCDGAPVRAVLIAE